MPFKVLRAYGCRVRHVDRMILACVVLGVSTRKVAQVLLPILGEPVSATWVSEVAQSFGWGLGRVSKEAQKALGRFSERWRGQYPKAVRLVIEDEEELLSFFKIKERSFWPKIRITNATKRRFRKVRRRTRPWGCSQIARPWNGSCPLCSRTKT